MWVMMPSAAATTSEGSPSGRRSGPSSRSRTMTSARVPWRFREKKVSWSMASIIRFSTSRTGMEGA